MDHLLSLWSEEDSSLFRSIITPPPLGLRSFPALGFFSRFCDFSSSIQF